MQAEDTGSTCPAPSQKLPVITNEDPKIITSLHWGLEPKWIKSVKSSGGIINVRMENLRDKPTFAADLKNRRCLIIADGFYEWKKEKDGKHPYWIYLATKQPFAFAGIWEENTLANGKQEKTFAIITTNPNPKIKKIHNRMPVILSKKEEELWLKEDDKDSLINLLDAYPENDLEAYEVELTVNSPAIDDKKLIQALK